jgi:E3 ubiquitin-protein ligase FANCL
LKPCRINIFDFRAVLTLNIPSDDANRKHVLQVSLPTNYPFVSPQITCELPVKLQQTASSLSLPQIYIKHQQLVNTYQPLFNCLDDLDQHMKILEPDKPNKSHIWRRIALGHHCSFEIELNPEAPMDMKPKIRFFGNLSRVKDLKDKWSNSEWYCSKNECLIAS